MPEGKATFTVRADGSSSLRRTPVLFSRRTGRSRRLFLPGGSSPDVRPVVFRPQTGSGSCVAGGSAFGGAGNAAGGNCRTGLKTRGNDGAGETEGCFSGVKLYRISHHMAGRECPPVWGVGSFFLIFQQVTPDKKLFSCMPSGMRPICCMTNTRNILAGV